MGRISGEEDYCEMEKSSGEDDCGMERSTAGKKITVTWKGVAEKRFVT